MSAPANSVYTNGGPPVTGDGLNTFVQTTTSVSTLRSFIGVSGMEIAILGTATAGDGGQGQFYWNATGTNADDNGVTTVIPNGSSSGNGEWSRITTSTSSVQGVTTNSNAATGYLGEYISSTVASGAAVALTTATPANVTSISLTAGDWDVSGFCALAAASTTVASIDGAGVNTTSATLPAAGLYTSLSLTFATSATQTLPLGTTRVSLATTTTVYLVAQATFTTSTLSAYGLLQARRVH